MTTNLVFCNDPARRCKIAPLTFFILENFAKTNRFVNKHLFVTLEFNHE